MNEKKGKRIGLTGGIGAGKSTASAYLCKMGVYVLDADEVSRAIVQPGCPGLTALVQRYGSGILLENGALNRSKLADIIFGSGKEREAVDALLHPIIKQGMFSAEEAYHEEYPGYPVIWDVPLLIESGMHTLMDEIWLVVADDDIRIERIMRRDGCSKEQAQSRIQSQMPQQEKIRYANVVISNNESQAVFCRQVHACLTLAIR